MTQINESPRMVCEPAGVPLPPASPPCATGYGSPPPWWWWLFGLLVLFGVLAYWAAVSQPW